MASIMIIASSLSEVFWAETWRAATHVRNYCSTNRRHFQTVLQNSSMKKSASSVKRLKEIEPNYDHMHPFECLCYVKETC
jgi:hypothetical protein